MRPFIYVVAFRTPPFGDLAFADTVVIIPATPDEEADEMAAYDAGNASGLHARVQDTYARLGQAPVTFENDYIIPITLGRQE